MKVWNLKFRFRANISHTFDKLKLSLEKFERKSKFSDCLDESAQRM